jgi:hypothetical protein
MTVSDAIEGTGGGNRIGTAFLRLDGAGRYQGVEPDARGRYHSAVLPRFRLDPARLALDPLPPVERPTPTNVPDTSRRYLASMLDEEV